LRPLRGLAFVLHEVVDRRAIDGVAVHTLPTAVDSLGWLARRLQNGDAQRYAAIFAVGAAVVVWVVLGAR
jgi:NADH-quinone oxidoreductase subunit L